MSRAPSYVPARKVIPSAELANIAQGSTFVQEARHYLESTAEQTKQELEAARQRGYDLGYAEGRREAMAAFAPLLAEIRTKLDIVENDLAQIISICLEKIIGNYDERELIYKILRTALADLSASLGFVLKVCPDELDMIMAEVDRLNAASTTRTIRKVEADPLLHRGEMVFETPRGRMHVGARHQLARLQAAMGTSKS